jgi:hypothetical protein
MLSQAKSHGNIFAATGGVHLTLNDIFMGIVLKQTQNPTREAGKGEDVASVAGED